MERVFKKLSDKKKVDLIPYLKEVIAGIKERENLDVRIYVGSGHDDRGPHTMYANVIVVHFFDKMLDRGKGAHVLYTTENIARVRDGFTKLWNEVTISLEVAKFIESEGLPKPYFIDLNLNPDPMHGSNNVLRAALGYVKSEGYNARCKPDSMAAKFALEVLG